MMFKSLDINAKTPRNLSDLKTNFSDGLMLQQFMGYFFLLGSLMLVCMAIFILQMYIPAFFMLLFTAFGFYQVKQVKQVTERRKLLFQKGEIMTATVVSHGRKFNIFKSTRDYTLIIKINDESGKRIEIVHRKAALTSSATIGNVIIGLTLNGEYFFGEEVGCRFGSSEENDEIIIQ